MMSLRMQTKKENRRIQIEDTAFKLFCERGIKKSSIEDIAKEAGIAKGTFYLYFNNKQDLVDHLVAREAMAVVESALAKLQDADMAEAEMDDKFIFVISEIIDYLSANLEFLEFIHKNLYSGLFKEENQERFQQAFKSLALINRKIDTEDFRQKVYLIFEMTGSVLYNALIKKAPYQLEEIKQRLFLSIRCIINLEEV